MNSDNHYDVAIVGGGVAGIFTGWRLVHDDFEDSEMLQALAAKRPDGRLRVGIFERSHRLGGRIESLEPPDMPSLRAEVGGMRFLTTQRLVSNLVAELGLHTHPFPVNQPENIYYLRGKHFRESDFRHPERIPYNLTWHEQGKTPGELIVDAIQQVIPGANVMNEAQWLKAKRTAKFRGEYLYNLGFWNVLLQVMSSEAYQLALDAGGYLSPLNNWNCADAMHFFYADFSPDAKFMSVVGGYEQLPIALAKGYEAGGGEVHLHHSLHGFEKGDAGMTLHFENGKTITAEHVVLAMPRRCLELLDQEGGFFQEKAVQDLIPTVTPQGMFKIFMCFRYPWWELTGVKQGKSNTDLPIRQTYYFGKESKSHDPADPAYRNALMMASYDDGRFVGYWEGMQTTDWRESHHTDMSKTAWERHAMPPAMSEEVVRQLKLLHDMETIPDPYAAAFKDWREEPYGGAWNSWNVRVKSWEVYEKMLQPLRDWQVYIVGESYSQQQGWVEGALQTAEEMLEEKFDLERPSWLSWG
jgi:monoamine oxidase